jgi:hypothetical protein
MGFYSCYLPKVWSPGASSGLDLAELYPGLPTAATCVITEVGPRTPASLAKTSSLLHLSSLTIATLKVDQCLDHAFDGL